MISSVGTFVKQYFPARPTFSGAAVGAKWGPRAIEDRVGRGGANTAPEGDHREPEAKRVQRRRRRCVSSGSSSEGASCLLRTREEVVAMELSLSDLLQFALVIIAIIKLVLYIVDRNQPKKK